MKRLNDLMDAAQHSSFKRKILQWTLGFAIPFNQPHSFKIIDVFENGIHILLPYKRKNLNHLKGIHACGLATLSEFVSGITLMRILKRDDLRIIMKDLKMTYHYQAKKDVTAMGKIEHQEINSKILDPLKNQDSVFYLMIIEVYDTEKNHISTAEINWQLKKWNKVKTH